jgi:proline iminopeptidase
VFLFGHSWGAILATGYINAYPNAISGVILAEPGGFTFDDVKEYVSRTRQLDAFDEASNDALYPDQFITGNENDHEVLDYKFSLYAFQDYSAVGDPAMCSFWRYGAVIQKSLFAIGDRDGFDWRANLNQYHTKVLFLYSEHNKAYGHDYALHVSSAYPNVQLSQINGSGHEMVEFAWNNVSPLTLTYLNSLK